MVGNHHNYDQALVIVVVMAAVVVIELVESVFSDLVDNEGNSYGDGDLVEVLVSSYHHCK